MKPLSHAVIPRCRQKRLLRFLRSQNGICAATFAAAKEWSACAFHVAESSVHTVQIYTLSFASIFFTGFSPPKRKSLREFLFLWGHFSHIQQNLWGWEAVRLWNVHRPLKAPNALVGSRALGAPHVSHSSVPRPPHTPWVQTERGTQHGSRVSATDSAPREKGLKRRDKKMPRKRWEIQLSCLFWNLNLCTFVCEHVSFALFSPYPHTCIRDWYLLDLAAGTDEFGFCPRD